MFRVLSAQFRILALALFLAGCGSNQTHELLSAKVVEAPASAIAATHDIFIATTRAKAPVASEVFSGQRWPETSYAEVDVTVPAIHKTGAIERRKKNQPADPAKFFVAESITGYKDSEAFSRALRSDIAAHDGRALVFIHGFNTAFDSAVYRIAQIAHDSGYTGTPVLFSWASAGKTLDYVYDNNSASAARDSLEQTLRLVAKSGAKRIDIIAHSMGNWVTMEALRQLAITGDRDLDNKLGDVLLASPDIDVDVFKTQMARYGKPDRPFILMLSGDDRALQLSSFIAGNRPRLGDYNNSADIANLGVVVVDLTKVSVNDRLNHTKFAENPLLVKMIGDRLSRSDDLSTSETEITDRVNGLAQGLGQTMSSAAEIIITTPLNVLNVVVGQ